MEDDEPERALDALAARELVVVEHHLAEELAQPRAALHHRRVARLAQLQVVHLARLLAWNATTAPTAHAANDPAGQAHAAATGCWGPWR